MVIPVSSYEIKTDYSITPFDDFEVLRGGMVQDSSLTLTSSKVDHYYGAITFQKGTNYYLYTRTFTKFDDVISYIGGLFGAIIGVMFMMNHYTKTAFEIILGSRMFNG